MTERGQANPSLWWKLSWQLSIVFVAVVASVIVGLCAYGATILSPNVGLKNKLTTALEEALARNPQGHLALVDSPRLRSLKAENDKLWFVAATPEGELVSYGDIPSSYANLARVVVLIRDADIRGARGVSESASIDSITTGLGEVRVMYGGNTSKSATFLTMLTATYPIYIPLLAIALPAVFLTVPRIVRGALVGLNSVVQKAPQIDPRRSGSRLPLDDVPKEVVPLIIAFNSILDRLEEQFKARQRFLIDAAHELRTPIAIMQTRIDGMADGSDKQRLMKDVGRLGATAEHLLDFERNDQVIDLHEVIDLVDVARTVVADLAPMAIAGGYEISFESDVEKLERRGSPSALPRAIANLVRNAIDHGGNKGAIVVTVSGESDITVADEGPGIPEEHQKLVFEPFYRVTPRSTGAGLGLSLVKHIISSHDGQVLLHSGPKGTRITLRL